ncbi:MAG: RDD family protein [Coriobacteriaceae bacterium]|nr:RDD family protein [Coriobacteriaceae bacterium]
MGKKRRRRPRAGEAAGSSRQARVESRRDPAPRECAGMLRRAAGWAVDWGLAAGLVSLFYFCAGVFYLDPATEQQGNLMLVCAVATLGLLTVWLPLRAGGRTLGAIVAGIAIENRDGTARRAGQLFVRECVLRVAAGPALAVFSLIEYVAVGLIVERDPSRELLVDRLLKTRVVRVSRPAAPLEERNDHV